MLSRVPFFFVIIVLTGFAAVDRVAGQSRANDPFSADNSDSQSEPMLGSPEREMRARLEIKQAEKERRENLERAREVAQLGVELREAYVARKSLDRVDVKKLERLEKLTRKIRSEAGGSDDEEMLKDMPRELDSALSKLAELSEELKKGVEKTPRLVISTTVIEHANHLLEVIGFIRTMTR